MEERLQKIIARAGVTSRRNAEKLIVDGKVSVNGLIERELGMKADAERDEIRVNGQLISVAAPPVYIMLHKPEHYVTTVKDPEGRPTVMSLVKRIRTRIYPVGRLDFDSSGLLLMTSDGEITRYLTHPSSRVPKTYHVKMKGRVAPKQIDELRKGPDIGGPPLHPSEVTFLETSRTGVHSWLAMTITEGRSRQIRNMGEAVGHPVLKLKRIAMGPLQLGDLEPGEFRYLTDKEISLLKRLVKDGPAAPRTGRRRKRIVKKSSAPAKKPGKSRRA